jgi:hypothetical protein
MGAGAAGGVVAAGGTSGTMLNGVPVTCTPTPITGSVTGQSVDLYSYYGALPAKTSSNYIPVTADFSAFAK